MQTPDNTSNNKPRSVTRRRALKTGAAVGIGAVVWTEPTIKGLARRPAYAAGGSGPATIYTVPLIPEFATGNGGGTMLPFVVHTDGPLTVTLLGPLPDGSHDNATPNGTYTLLAEVDGCICVWTDDATTTIGRNGIGFVDGTAQGDNRITFEWVGARIANRFSVTNPLTLSCS